MKGNSVLGSVVQGRRELLESERQFLAHVYSRKLKRMITHSNAKDFDLRGLNTSKIEEYLDKGKKEYSSINADPEVWRRAVKVTMEALFGDPQAMIKERHIRLQALPYWNPTQHKINIHALGVVKTVKIVDEPGFKNWRTGKLETRQRQETVDFEEFVEPGQIVYIPYTYTTGGKHSSIYGVAPQLKPLPVMHEDWFGADLSPNTYTEWCTFMHPDFVSNCCGRPGGWNVQTNKLVCSKCGKDGQDMSKC